jgi:alpha-methylacyl-CoA racemase
MGPLAGVKVLEMDAIGPVPWAAMMLSDMGADVLRIDRSAPPELGMNYGTQFEFTKRGQRSVIADLKQPAAIDAVLHLASRADVLIEGLRPGVMERLGLGPEPCMSANPALVYGRMTGWGQGGPLANSVGHDINYISIAGALHTMGKQDAPPAVPLNLIGDYGGGGMLLVVGVLAALLEARSSGKGQVVDAAMVDGTLALMAPVLGMWRGGGWKDQRESNVLDGGAHFYGTYATSDGKSISVGAIEPRFYAALLKGLGLEGEQLPKQHDRESWPAMRKRFAEIFARQTRDHWCRMFEGTEACVAPVLSLEELAAHPHHQGRRSFVEVDGVMQPAPAPRFSRTQSEVAGPAVERGVGGGDAIERWGFDPADPRLAALRVAN